MDLWKSSQGMVRLELTSADPAGALMHMAESGIEAYDVLQKADDISITFSVLRTDIKRLEALARKKGHLIRYLGRVGIYWTLRSFLRRPVLVLGAVFLIVLSLYLPGRIFFVQVEGNRAVPTRLILEKCQQSGVCFGASRRQLRSEAIKNQLLAAIPQLQWAGVNTHGCVAVVTVRERAEQGPNAATNYPVSSIVALRDGVITRCTVTKGTQICTVGQAVRAGQVLVSGYTDCGICIQAGPSEGEIYAQTERSVRSVIPLQRQNQTAKGAEDKKYALIIGKKRINFYKGSGISGTTCDKMYEEYYITLPGGFALPVSIMVETVRYCETAETEWSEEAALSASDEFHRRYLKSIMAAGSILDGEQRHTCLNGLLILEGNYACEEMIGQVKSEEIGSPNG